MLRKMKIKYSNSMSFWKPMKAKHTKINRNINLFPNNIKLVKIKPIQINIINNKYKKTTLKKNLTYHQAINKYPKLTAFGDADRDGKLNMFDCKPFDKKRHGKSRLLQEEIARRVFKAELKDIDKGYIEEAEGKKIKHFSKRDIIKHAAKHPRLIKELEKVDEIFKVEKPLGKKKLIAAAVIYKEPKLTEEGKIKRSKSGEIIYGEKKHGIEMAEKTSLKENIGENVEHELAHIQQYRNREKGRNEGEEFLKQTQEEIEKDKEYYENLEKRYKSGEELKYEEYNKLKNELDAENRRNRLKAIEKGWSDEKPKAIIDLEKMESN